MYNPTPLPSNEYSLLIYLRQNNTKYYYSYIGKDEIIISSNDNILSFHLSPIFASNGIFLNKIPRNSLFVMNCLRHTENYQCNDIQIQRLAKQITEGLFLHTIKLKLFMIGSLLIYIMIKILCRIINTFKWTKVV